MRTPSSALPAWPYGLLLGRGTPLPIALIAGFFVTLSLTTRLTGRFAAAFFAAGAERALAFTFFAIMVLPNLALVCGCGGRRRTRSFLLQHALRVEVADAAALAAGGRVDHSVDQGRLAGIHGRVDGALELVGCGGVNADAAEGFHHLVVARALDEDGRRRIRTAAGIDVGPAIDAVVVEDDHADRQAVPADGLDLHAGEAKGAVAFDREHRLAGLDRRRDGNAHADAHDAPGTDFQALCRLVHVDDAAGEIERIGALVDQHGVRPFLDDGAQRTERAVKIHRRRVVHEPRRHLGDVFFFFR